jgi:hypothetical protein
VVSGSSQISLSGFSTTNLSEGSNLYYTDTRVKTKLNADGVVSGSSQLTSDFDTRYINTSGDGVVSGSAQIDGGSITNGHVTIAGNQVDLNGSNISFAQLAESTGVISGSSQLTSSYDNRYLNVGGDGIISESAQVNADSITNFDSNVLSYNNSLGIVSGSSQLTSDYDSRYLNTVGNSVISQSAQVDGLNIQNNSITIAGNATSLGDTITFSTIVAGTGTITGSAQVVLNDADKTNFDTADVVEGSNLYYTDTRVKTKLNTEAVLSGSITSADITDVAAFSQSGTYANLRAQATTAGDVGLGNVTNESKATMFTSPTFTGTPISTTPSSNDDSTKIATTAYVQQELTDLVGTAGSTLDTLGELSASLAEDSGSLASLVTTVGTKLAKSSNLSDLANAGTARSNLGVSIGSDVQAYNSTLDTVAAGTYTGDNSITTIGTITTGNVTSILPSGVVSGSDQVQALGGVNNNTITFTAGNGLDGGGAITLNQGSDETVTFTVGDGVVSGSDQIASTFAQTILDDTSAGAVRTTIGVDAAGTDNSTDVTLGNTNYLSISGQAITGGTVPIGSGGTGATSAGAARTALGVDAAGTDNSTDVTLTGTPDYLTISGQAITIGQVDYSTDISNTPTTITSTQASDITTNNDKVGYTDALVKTKLNAETVISSSAQLEGTFLEINGDGVVSGSSQIDIHNTDGYVANENINHSSVSITAGDGMSGGGNITQTRTLSLNTGSGHFSGGIKTRLDAENIISQSSQVTAISNTQLAGSIANSKLVNSSISIDGSVISLGDSVTTLQLGTSDSTALAGNTRTISSGEITSISTNSNKVGYTDALVKTKLNTETVISSSAQITALGYSTTDNELTTEEVQDIVGGMLGGTETGITVTYQDSTGDIDFVVASQTDENFTTADHDKLDGIEANAEVNRTAAETRDLVGTGNEGVIPTEGTAGHFLKHDGTFGLPSYTTNTNTQLTQEQVEDFVGGMLDGTETGITVGYDDVNGNLDFVVATQSDNNFTTALKDKLDNIEALADVTDTGNVHPILDAKEVLSGSITSADITDVAAFSQSGTYASLRAQGTTAGDVGLGNVTNESKATMFSGAALTNNPTAPTQTGTNDSTRIATTAFVQSRIDSVIGTAGSTLDTLGELSASLDSDSGSLASLVTTVGTKLAKSDNLSDLADAGTARSNLGVDAAGTVNYTLPLGTSSARGGFKIGYSESGQNYPVELSSERMYVNVPWTDNNDNTQLSNEQVQDIVGGMLGGTETGITVTYQDSTNDIDFVVASQTDNNFTTTLKDKLDNIEENADVTDSANVLPILNANTVISGSGQITALGFSTTDNELSTEEVQDIVGGMVSGNTESGITVTYDDVGNSLDFSVASQTENDFTTVLKDKLDNIEENADVNLTAAQTRTLVGTGNAGVIPTIGTDGHFLKHDGTFGLPSYTTNTDTQLSTEQVQDIVGGMVSGNTESGITVTYDDTGNSLDFSVASQTANDFTNDLKDKLDNIEALADVTDAANVLANLPSGIVSGSSQISGITNTQLAGSITNAKLTNSSITINGTAISLGDSVSTPNDNTQLSTEAVQDIVGGMFSSNTETRVSATYDDSSGKINVVVDDMTANDNTQLTTDAVQDIVGAMFSGNTETRIAATYQDGDGTIDLVVTDMTANDNTQNTTTLSFVDSTNDIILRNTTGGHSSGTQDIKLVAGSNVTLTHTDANNVTISSTDTNTVYSHPSHDGDDLSVDTGTLSGATVISDLDFNVNTNALGHVTDATLTTLTTRELSKSDIGLGNVANETRATILGGDLTGTINNIAVATVTDGAALGATSNQDSTSDIQSGTTATNVGLGNVTNESKATMFASPTFTGTVAGVTKSHVGLGNVANETRATILGGDLTGTINSIAVATVTDGAALGATSNQDSTSDIQSGTTATNVGLGNVTNESKATMFASPTFTGTVSGVSATHVGLGNVTNESKATMFTSAALTSNPTAPTQTGTDDSTKIATTAFVQGRIDAIIGTAGSTLDTLGELSASLDSDSGSLASLVTTVGGKLQKDQNLSDLGDAGTARTNLGLTGGTAGHFLKHDGTFGLPSYTTNTDTNDNTQNTYSTSVVSSSGIKLRLTGAGHDGATTDDVKFVGAGGATVTRTDASTITITTTDSDTTYTRSDFINQDVNTDSNVTFASVSATGDVVAYASSDERLKDNIEVISNPIEKVQSLKGVTWDWNDNADKLQQSLPNVGVIAQDVEKVLPQLVKDRDNGFKGVDYAKLTGLLIEAIKEQQKEIDILKEKLG